MVSTCTRRQALVSLSAATISVGIGSQVAFAENDREAGTREIGGTWNAPGFDSGKSGFHPEATVPKDDISAVWRQSEGPFGPAVDNGVVYSVDHLNIVRATELQTGERLWETRLRDDSTQAALPRRGSLIVKQNLVIGAGTEWIWALEADSGDPVWTVEPESGVTSALGTTGDMIYAADGALLAIDITNGEELWRNTDGAYFDSGPAIHDGVLYLGDSAGILSAIDAESGETRWQLDIGTELRSSPAVQDGYVVLVDREGHVHAVNIEEQAVVWSRGISAPHMTSPSIAEGNIFVSSHRPDALNALDLQDGSTIWRREHETQKALGKPAVADGSVVYAAGNSLQCADTNTGELFWEFHRGTYEESPPAIINGGVVVGDVTGGDHNLLLLSGSEFEFSTENGVDVTQPTDDGETEATQSTDSGETDTTQSINGDERTVHRGFFSNTEEEPGALGDAFNLTILGMTLSIIGIGYQLIQGR